MITLCPMSPLRRLLVVSAALAAILALPATGNARPGRAPLVERRTGAVAGDRAFALPRRTTHVAVYWRGSPRARVRVALSRDGRTFGRFRRVRIDELGGLRHDGVTYGNLMVARGVMVVRVRSDRRLSRLTVLGLTDRGAPTHRVSPPRASAATAVAQPLVISRAGWGADESLRFEATGKEIWPPAFYPVQKLIVHHTDTQNNDPDPAATIRSIYYYHAVTQGWGDIGYNFLIDEFGRIYEGRHSQNSWDPATYPSGPTGGDANGDGVTAAHAQGFNSGTVGIALLGTLSDHDATPAARDALERLLAWEASAHGIDPQGSALYTNPVSGTRATFPNIAGHRDVNATDCPGAAFYATLPAIRADVAARLAGTASPDVSLNTSVGGSVPATLSLRLGASATFGSFTPGVTKDYTAAITAQVVSTAGAGRLSVADPSADHTGQLVNGRYALPSQLQAKATSLAGHGFAFADVGSGAGPTPLLTYGDPVSNDPVAITFSQHIGATDVLRTGAYAKTLTFTLSTAQP